MIFSTLEAGDPCPRCSSARKRCCVLNEHCDRGDETYLRCSGNCDENGFHDNEPEWMGWCGPNYDCTTDARHNERFEAVWQQLQRAGSRLDALLKPRAVSLAVPDDLRALGWSVGVHNDYVLNGQRYTFWLMTHPSGRYLKGEGESDLEALNRIRDQLESDKWAA